VGSGGSEVVLRREEGMRENLSAKEEMERGCSLPEEGEVMAVSPAKIYGETAAPDARAVQMEPRGRREAAKRLRGGRGDREGKGKRGRCWQFLNRRREREGVVSW
jgi:hypothetical protein